ncbi:uncharacterized protein LOC108039786 [Drosophila rhopaloa]|uniref:Uncharacterized protein LOC108039786 n=1 Tax=Drosophila rhopaloa TaxID=1041015 RepID=A0A6P4E2Z0_DRORH|nr:uncharacterized protein LOC108039786 [Drosophila rhopaloa]
MISLILYICIFYTAAAARNLKVVKYENSVDTIVKDLVDNWQSPLVYLKSRGYLPKDLQNAPELDFQQLQGNLVPDLPIKDLFAFNKDSKRDVELKNEVKTIDQRAARSLDDPKELDLKRMFQSLFSSNDKAASEEIKSKLGVSWDMNALKSSARLGAKKFLDKFNSKRNQVENVVLNEAKDAAVSYEGAHKLEVLVPSHILEKKSNESMDKSAYNKPNFLKGVAKILSNPEIRIKDWDTKPAQESVHKGPEMGK